MNINELTKITANLVFADLL